MATLDLDVPFDRAAEKRARREAMRSASASPEGLYVPVWRNKSIVRGGEPPRAALLPRAAVEPWLERAESTVFLGESAGRPVFALGLPGAGEVAQDPGFAEAGAFNDLRIAGMTLPAADAGLLAYARGMTIWHRYQKHCGRCGETMRSADGGHVRLCPGCDTRHFPRTDPAMMALITRGDTILLARSPRFPPKMHSILAGFVEPGESLEDSVRREVKEEVGLDVVDVRYVKSQGWPFPHSLMIGFAMRSEAGPIVLDDEEIEAAAFYTKAQVAAAEEIFVPPRFSLAGQLIRAWMSDEL